MLLIIYFYPIKQHIIINILNGNVAFQRVKKALFLNNLQMITVNNRVLVKVKKNVKNLTCMAMVNI
jgi:hypothetical protein